MQDHEGTALMSEEIICYKGFSRDWSCRGFQFALGGTYEHEGEVKVCESGFHACQHPLEVFDYYAPATSRYAEVRLSGAKAWGDGNTKHAAAKITITAEVPLREMVERAVKHVVDRAVETNEASAAGKGEVASATGNMSAASATGYRGAASATGEKGAASATDNMSVASATGNMSAASATGSMSAASATGNMSAASATGEHSVAMACGSAGHAMASEGCAIFLVERNLDLGIVAVWAGIAGSDGIEPGVWYTLREGKPVRV